MGFAGGDCRDAGVDLRQPGLHVALQQLAAFGQNDAAMHPVEQAYAEQLLQALDLLADRRLGAAQLRRGSGEALLAGGAFEHPQQFQRNAHRIHKPALSEACSAMRFNLVGRGRKLDHSTIP
ncbi:hypothetical protein D3C76_1268070 [compost metagenome]